MFDGHGGKDAALFVRDNLPRVIVEDADFPVELEKVVTRSFVQIDNQFAETCSLQSALSSGTTALTAMIFGRSVITLLFWSNTRLLMSNIAYWPEISCISKLLSIINVKCHSLPSKQCLKLALFLSWSNVPFAKLLVLSRCFPKKSIDNENAWFLCLEVHMTFCYIGHTVHDAYVFLMVYLEF